MTRKRTDPMPTVRSKNVLVVKKGGGKRPHRRKETLPSEKATKVVNKWILLAKKKYTLIVD